MGRLTQMIDYLNRDPEDFSKEFVIANYTHFTVTDKAREVRRKYRNQIKKDKDEKQN